MLKSLLIENYALIEKLDISFDAGLTIITGETGAGKSILLGALGLILGQRADTRALHNKNIKCIIEGTFSVKDIQIQHLFDENDLDYDDITILRREINPQGKSRAFINDTPVNLSVMKILAEKLIDIHSQHQSLLFADSSFRYDLLDSWANIMSLVSSYKILHHHWVAAVKSLEQLQESEKQTRAELDYYQFQFDELHKAALIPGEMEELNSELGILNNAGEIKFGLEKANFILQNNQENVLSSLNELLGIFRPFEKFDQSYGELFNRLQSASIELKDIADTIAGLKDDVEDDPKKAVALQERFDLIQKLLHKHNVADIDELISIRNEFEERIQGFETLELQIEELTKNIKEKEKELTETAIEISQKRKRSLESLERQINDILKELGMPNGRFKVNILPSENLHARGKDDLAFLFSANLGLEPQELSKVASGGELSRLMLAVKSVISLKNLLPTIIFDEIDTGVSGEIGIKMGRILNHIAQNMQVISVTHLPQVAAKGKKHFVVFKKTENQKTKTFVKELNPLQRIEEIAKMMGGENPGKAVIQAAEELIEKQNINQN
jgi:DNA repair protein RecN (Recombination protein N)